MAPRTTSLPTIPEEHHFSVSALITLVVVLLIFGGIVVYNRMNVEEAPAVGTPVVKSTNLTEAEKVNIAENSKANDTLTPKQKETALKNSTVTNTMTAEEKSKIAEGTK